MMRKFSYALIALAPLIAGAQVRTPSPSWNLSDAVGWIISIINLIIPILGGVALIVFFVGLIRYIRSASGGQGKVDGRTLILWGLITLFVLFSVWGIVGILRSTFLSATGQNAGTPLDISPGAFNADYPTYNY